jgi:hypothetical protein
MEGEDYFEFQELKKYINVNDIWLFKDYMKEVYKDLSDRAESNKKKGISKITFFEYIKLPIFLSEKLFTAFDIDNDLFLSQREFVDNLVLLYLGDFHETISLIFKILDFDKDTIICKGDVKLLLSYLPLKSEKNEEYKFQMESLEEIEQILKGTFLNKETLNENEFIEIIESKKSDIYFLLICYLYQKKPFNDKNVNMLKQFSRRSSNKNNETDYAKLVSPESKRIKSPNKKSIFSPIDSIFKLNPCEDDDLNDRITENNNTNTNNNINSNSNKNSINKKSSLKIEDQMKGVVRMENKKIIQEAWKINNDNHNKKEENLNPIKNSKNVFESPSIKFLKNKKNTQPQVSDFSLDDNLIKLESMNMDDNDNDNHNNNNEDNGNRIDNKSDEIIHEDWVFKLSESLKLKKYWLVLIGKDIYYYKDEKKQEMLGMHNMSGCFVKENGQKKISDELFYSFTIQFSSKSRNYYCFKQEDADIWLEILKDSIGYKSFFDYYEMRDEIGEGKFGLVKLGVHKKSKEKVAIKIIKKESMSNSDIELVKGEIDIMKLCRHPNIVQLYDHFENADYIFIIMEYLKGGDLEQYLNKINFRITENKARNIIHQLSSGIKYLHEYGILHRDLKPENIMLTENTENGIVKIMDFGLSTILGPEEKVTDGFGTLSFVAPEVLVRQPYNRQIDIWSIGVILYYMLSEDLPFDDEDDDEEKIAKMTVYDDVKFLGDKWSKRSQEVIDFIRECLIKDPDRRIKINDLLNHPWINQRNNKSK